MSSSLFAVVGSCLAGKNDSFNHSVIVIWNSFLRVPFDGPKTATASPLSAESNGISPSTSW